MCMQLTVFLGKVYMYLFKTDVKLFMPSIFWICH